MAEETLASVLTDRPEETQTTPEEATPDEAQLDDAGAEEAGDGEERDEKAEADSSDEQPKQKRTGYQRIKAKLAKSEADRAQAQLERDFFKQIAMKDGGSKESDGQNDEKALGPPKIPLLSEYQGNLDEYEKELKEYPDKLRKFLEAESQQKTLATRNAKAAESFRAKVLELPEIDELREQIGGMSDRAELINYVEQIAAPLKNGPEVVKEVLLDPDLREQLLQLDNVKDGQGIRAQLHAISAGLLIANRKSATQEKETPEPPKTRAPKPLSPVTKPTVTDNSLRDDLPIDEWKKRRNAQVYGK